MLNEFDIEKEIKVGMKLKDGDGDTFKVISIDPQNVELKPLTYPGPVSNFPSDFGEDVEMEEIWMYLYLPEEDINEAEYQGKDVQLNKPKRGGSKAYYVYVRDPKTKKVKKVSFGSGGLRAKIKNKDARNAFAKRHNCDQKKDRTKAGYWSCNLPRYAKALGLGNNMNTYW